MASGNAERRGDRQQPSNTSGKSKGGLFGRFTIMLILVAGICAVMAIYTHHQQAKFDDTKAHGIRVGATVTDVEIQSHHSTSRHSSTTYTTVVTVDLDRQVQGRSSARITLDGREAGYSDNEHVTVLVNRNDAGYVIFADEDSHAQTASVILRWVAVAAGIGAIVCGALWWRRRRSRPAQPEAG